MVLNMLFNLNPYGRSSKKHPKNILGLSIQ